MAALLKTPFLQDHLENAGRIQFGTSEQDERLMCSFFSFLIGRG